MKPRHALTLLPLALGLVGGLHAPSATAPAPTTATHPAIAAKQFSVPLDTLQKWASSVVVEVDAFTVEGHSPVHALIDDCEMHLGGHTPNFAGDPDGLVLEPMNACVQPPPKNFSDWPAFGDSLLSQKITAFGVPRIWPEHLNGGSSSNPDHAAELHPLTSLTSAGATFDFAPNIFAGQYKGGVGSATALQILHHTFVSVSLSGNSVGVNFTAGTIGNFTILNLTIDPASIVSDGAGSFRAEAVVDSVSVHLVAAKGSTVNTELEKMKSGGASLSGDTLVLFSLSPQALLTAANKSHGAAVTVSEPLQLILYGVPDS
jgi:hypothetical protein